MNTIERFLERLNREIEKLSYGEEPKELYEPVSYMMGLGGKRMRPLLTLLSANLFSEDIEKAIKPAMAVELFHNFTLMHDDIMDNAPLRRGKETVHEKWNNSVAILSGDVMLVKAYRYFMDLEGQILKEALEAFNRCAEDVCEGQQFDMNFEKRDNVSEKEYLGMIHLKTAALLGFSLELGGIVTGTSGKNKKLLKEFGENMGIGFQLMDDLLDVYGDHSKFGKQVGGDIASNKKTFLTIKAFGKAQGQELEKLKKYFSEKPGDPSQKIKEVTSIYDRLNIRQLTEEKINQYFEKGLRKLTEVDAPMYKKAIIRNLAQSLMTREN